MSVAAPNYYEAIAHLPAGAALRLDHVSWKDYEQLLDELGESYSVRIFYDDGRMEIMAPAVTHERPREVLNTLVKALRDALDIDVIAIGATTLKADFKAKGAEPDDAFYIQNAARMMSRQDLDLKQDPPPDLVVEVDHTSSSLNKFSIYAALGVPEIWRLVNTEVQIYLLGGERYETSPNSRAFPVLSAQKLSHLLVLGLAEGERKAARSLRDWLREQ